MRDGSGDKDDQPNLCDDVIIHLIARDSEGAVVLDSRFGSIFVSFLEIHTNNVFVRTSTPEGFSFIVGDTRVPFALTAAVVSLRKGETSLFAFSVCIIISEFRRAVLTNKLFDLVGHTTGRQFRPDDDCSCCTAVVAQIRGRCLFEPSAS